VRNPFYSARQRIRWAKENLAQFERSAKRFFRSTKPEIVVEPDPDPAYEVHKARFAKPLPGSLTNKTVAAIENLRAALDHAAVNVANLASAAHPDKTHFPFSRTEADFKGRLNSTCGNLPDDFKTLFASFRPYCGGDDILWAVNEICNLTKHRAILSVSHKTELRYEGGQLKFGVHTLSLNNATFSWVGNEVVIARALTGTKPQYHAKLTSGVAFGKVPIVERREVFIVLREMIERVTTIVDKTEAKCREIGLLA
jgi:hypothetical protein